MAKQDIKDTLKQLSEEWFLTEPAFFALYCQQQLEENARMDCSIRCGNGKLEYNPLILSHKNYREIDQLIRIELIRLFLKHPYERRPDGCCQEAMSIGSNVTIADSYCGLHKEKLPLHEPAYYHLPIGQYYEWYAKHIQQQQERQDKTNSSSSKQTSNQESNKSSEGNDSAANPGQDHAQLWQENSLERERINALIERTTDWGSIPSNLVESIKASTKARINQKLIWQGFHSAIICCQRKLTRMKPNRRTGFLQMGSTRQQDTRILAAVDVSGSINDAILSDFYSSINRIFRYGTVQIDICQFDAELGPVRPMNRASKDITIVGRGGTNYQPVINYILDHQTVYDGLIILTDGIAPNPELGKSQKFPILWVLPDANAYETFKERLQKLGRVTHL